MSQSKEIIILQLYPNNMNIYGDWGNTLAIKRRLEKHGFSPRTIDYNVGDTLPNNVDIIVGGGGQDSGQSIIQGDLLAIGPRLKDLAADGVPMLMICGMYQLFGHRFITNEGAEIHGIGLLDIETKAGPKRLSGNVVAESDEFGVIVGYENHSGQTSLGKGIVPLAKIRLGAGNNEHDGHEGARHLNIIGSYLHGSLLPKNPKITDFLIEKAALRKFSEFQPAAIDDSLAEQARQIAIERPR